MVEEVDIVQECVEHGIFLGKPTRRSLLFKCDPSSMDCGLETFPNRDVNYINIRLKPQYYNVLIITLLSTKKKRESF